MNHSILIVPGATASGLYMSEKTRIYDKHELVFLLAERQKKMATFKNLFKFFHNYKHLCLDEKGRPKNSAIGVFDIPTFNNTCHEEVYKFGVCLKYKNLIQTLTKSFPEKKVKLFNYDFRICRSESALALIEEINRYDSVIIIAHSNGGLILAKALSLMLKLGQPIEKIAGCFLIAVPWMGTLQAVRSVTAGLNDYPSEILNLFSLIGQRLTKHLMRTFILTYQLIAPKILDFIISEKKEKMQMNELKNILNSKIDLKHIAQRQAIEKIDDYYNDFFVDSKFSINYLQPVYNIIGDGLRTESLASLKSNGKFKIIDYSNNGDKFVLTSSAHPPTSSNMHINGELKTFNLTHCEIQNHKEVIEYLIKKIKKLFVKINFI